MKTFMLKTDKEMFGKYMSGKRSIGLKFYRIEVIGVLSNGEPQFSPRNDRSVEIEIREELGVLYVWVGEQDTAFTIDVKWREDIFFIRGLFKRASDYVYYDGGLFDLLSHIAEMQNITDIPF